ncbi:hypothetical protein [Nevskia sp.]|uniref:hypothetical protein n=1 Tax=Nevskia sp. TaxID=1929292 RepID=UPI0025CB7FC6|nr:hypothetical protein [Nevskia sp.]
MTCRSAIPNRIAAPPAPVSIDDQAQIAADELPHQIARLKWLAEHEKLHWGTYQIRKRALTAGVATLTRLARQQTGLAHLRQIIASDATAISYQTLGQYRTALLREIDAQLLGSSDAEAGQAGEGSPS